MQPPAAILSALPDISSELCSTHGDWQALPPIHSPRMPAAQQAAAVSSMQPSCSSRFQAHNAPAAGRSANIRPCTALPPRTQRATRLIVKRRLGDRQVSCATSSQEVGKLISRVEIPAFIPRQDLMDQLARWAVIEVQENGVANLGMPTKVRAAAC